MCWCWFAGGYALLPGQARAHYIGLGESLEAPRPQGSDCCRRSCTTALACPRKVALAGRKLGLVHWIFIRCVIWSMIQASLPPLCQILLWHTAIFLVFLVLHLGYEVVCELVTQALATWTIWADGGRWTQTLHLMLVHHALAWCHTQIAAGRWQCGMNHLSYLS